MTPHIWPAEARFHCTTRSIGVAIGALTLLFLTIAGVLWLSSTLAPAKGTTTGPGLLILLLAFLILVLTLVPVSMRWFEVGVKCLAEPLAWVSVSFILYYVLRGIMLLLRDSIDFQSKLVRNNPATPADIATAMALALLGLVMFHCGYRFWKQPRQTSVPPSGVPWSGRALRHVMIACTAIALGSTVLMLYLGGDLQENFGRLRSVTQGFGYGVQGIAYWGILFAFSLQDYYRRKRGLPIVLSLLVIANIVDMLFGNRAGVVATWMTGFTLSIMETPKKGSLRLVGRLLLTTIAGFVFILPMVRVREQAHSLNDAARIWVDFWTEDSQRTVVHALDEFAALDSFAAMVSGGTAEFPLRYGKTYLDVVLFMVPRVMWPDKPRVFSVAFGDYITGDGNDLPPGFIGELYINFHLLGIAAGTYLMGVFLRTAHTWMLHGDPVTRTAYAVLAPYLIVFMGRSFIGGGIMMTVLFGLMVPIMLYCGRARRSLRGQRLAYVNS